jgi:hypothetical protein
VRETAEISDCLEDFGRLFATDTYGVPLPDSATKPSFSTYPTMPQISRLPDAPGAVLSDAEVAKSGYFARLYPSA